MDGHLHSSYFLVILPFTFITIFLRDKYPSSIFIFTDHLPNV